MKPFLRTPKRVCDKPLFRKSPAIAGETVFVAYAPFDKGDFELTIGSTRLCCQFEGYYLNLVTSLAFFLRVKHLAFYELKCLN